MTRLGLISLGVVGVLVVAGCDGNSARVSVTEPAGEAQLRMMLKRSAASLIPAAAESAFVRVWNNTGSINALKSVAIPAPGTTASVDFLLPVGEGYSVGVIAYAHDGYMRQGLALGVAREVPVRSGVANEAQVDVKPPEFSISAAPVFESGSMTEVTVRSPLLMSEDFFVGVRLDYGLEPWSEGDTAPVSTGFELVRADSVAIPFTVPTVDADTAVYMQAGFGVLNENWVVDGMIEFLLPSVRAGAELYRVPVAVPSSGLTVVF